MGFFSKKTAKQIMELKEQLKNDKRKLQRIKPKLSEILTNEYSTKREKIMALNFMREFATMSEANSLITCFANKAENSNIRLKAYTLLAEWFRDGKIKKVPNQLINGLQIKPERYMNYFLHLFEYNPKLIGEKILELCDDQRFIFEVRLELVKKIIEYQKKNNIKISKRKYTKKLSEMIVKLIKKLICIEKNNEALIESGSNKMLTNVANIKEDVKLFYEEASIMAAYICDDILGPKEENYLIDFAELLYERRHMELAAQFITKINSAAMVNTAIELFHYLKNNYENRGQSSIKIENEIRRYLWQYKIVPFEKKATYQ